MLESTCRAAELRVVDESSFKSSERCTLVRGFPLSTVEEARKLSKKLFDEYSPKAIIAIERPGRNEKGVYHTGRGYDMSPWTAKLDYTFDEAKERRILTIGIGDYGNEAGLGQIREIVREVFPYGAKCRCPCGAGNATAVESDVGVIGSCSNTGAYGVTACLSALLGEPELLQSPELERIMLLECSKMGGADGLTKTCTLRVDGITADTYVSTVQILGEIIRQGLTEIHPLFH